MVIPSPAVIDVESPVDHATRHQEATADLQFQDFYIGENTPSNTDQKQNLLQESLLDGEGGEEFDEGAGLLAGEKKAKPSFWEFRFYQRFFDVDTNEVLRRILWSVVPSYGNSSFITKYIQPNPDLYGPFWISATLVITTAITANLADYLQSAGHKHSWHYDYNKISISATLIYLYTFITPLIVWGLLRYKGENRFSLTDLICLYGYSLSVYIPISILWMIQFVWLHWTLVIIGALLSGSVLFLSVWPAIRATDKKVGVVLVCIVLGLHAALALAFATYFFQPSFTDQIPILVATTHSVTSTTTMNSVNVSHRSNIMVLVPL